MMSCRTARLSAGSPHREALRWGILKWPRAGEFGRPPGTSSQPLPCRAEIARARQGERRLFRDRGRLRAILYGSPLSSCQRLLATFSRGLSRKVLTTNPAALTNKLPKHTSSAIFERASASIVVRSMCWCGFGRQCIQKRGLDQLVSVLSPFLGMVFEIHSDNSHHAIGCQLRREKFRVP
jgi:hypothetical protein